MPNELDTIMTNILIIDLDPNDDLKFRVSGATFVHKDRLVQIPGARFVGRGRDYWTLPRTWVSAKMVRRLFEGHYEWTQDATGWLSDLWVSTIEPSLQLRNEGAKQEWIDYVRTVCPPDRQPRDYQVSGALFLATAKRAVLLDEQGTGKMTQTAMALSLYPETVPALVIAPKSVTWTWQAELRKFGIDSIVLDASDSAEKRRKALDQFDPVQTPVCIVPYSLMIKHSRVAGYGKIKLSETDREVKGLNLIPWQSITADEAHRIKEPTNASTRAVWAVSEHAPYRWATTGTPTESDLVDLWSVLHFIDPHEWPTRTGFIDNWIQHYTDFFGVLQITGLNPFTEAEFRDITDWHWRRVEKEGLPPRTEMDVFGFLSPKERTVYKAMEKDLMADIGGEGWTDVLVADNHAVKAGRLMQAANATLVFDADDNVRMIEPSSKLDLLRDRLEAHPNTPTILWFKNRDLLHLQEARFDKAEVPYVSIHGDITGRDRAEAVRRFQDGEVDFILITVAAGSEGVTLTRAPLAIYVQREHSRIKHSQSKDRHHRIGSEIHDEVAIEYLIMKDTVEELLTEQLAEKEGAAVEFHG